jgi:hypothetical protein
MKKKLLRKEIEEGEIIPPFYGVAYPRLESRHLVCYPFPINYLVRIKRDFWLKVRNAKLRAIEKDIIYGLAELEYRSKYEFDLKIAEEVKQLIKDLK